ERRCALNFLYVDLLLSHAFNLSVCSYRIAARRTSTRLLPSKTAKKSRRRWIISVYSLSDFVMICATVPPGSVTTSTSDGGRGEGCADCRNARRSLACVSTG